MGSVKKLSVKWNGKILELDLVELGVENVGDLKHALQSETNVPVERQKLIGLKLKAAGKGPVTDESNIGMLDLKPSTRIIMIGQPQDIVDKLNEKPTDIGEVVDDFDIDEAVVPLREREEFLAKIEKRVKNYKIDIINQPRDGKHLLVLDIDYTIYDHKSSADTIEELTRPFLHEFLARVYKYYDIVIWSATNMKWIRAKVKEMRLTDREEFSFTFFLDCSAMISVHIENRGLVNVKPLAVIWGKFPGNYSSKNTIMLDDVSHNFLMNPENGLKIRPFREAHLNRDKDEELLKLAEYLTAIARNEKDFSTVDIKHWEKYKPSL